MGVVVHNGSTLFSGDAGSAESNIRKWMLDIDIVEAIIQLPTDEFFNTGIYTYLWVLNKNKQTKHIGKVMIINASGKFTTLKKNKGSKRKVVDEVSRIDIVETLTRFEDNDYAKVYDKEFFYFNKQVIMVTNIDEFGKSFEEKLPMVLNKRTGLEERSSSLSLAPVEISNGDQIIKEFNITTFDSMKYDSLREAYEQDIKQVISSLDYREQSLIINTGDARYWFDKNKESLIKEINGKTEILGCGKINLKATYKKASKTQPERIEITAELTADYQKDYEIIPFYKNALENQKAIKTFMEKYITKPFIYLENIVGVEINFNKIFYKKEKLREVVEILGEINELDIELKALEEELEL